MIKQFKMIPTSIQLSQIKILLRVQVKYRSKTSTKRKYRIQRKNSLIVILTLKTITNNIEHKPMIPTCTKTIEELRIQFLEKINGQRSYMKYSFKKLTLTLMSKILKTTSKTVVI